MDIFITTTAIITTTTTINLFNTEVKQAPLQLQPMRHLSMTNVQRNSINQYIIEANIESGNVVYI